MILDSQQLIRRHLMDAFLELSQKNPQYSLRAFAKKLGTSNSSLSEMMRGKRKISKKNALEFASRMALSKKDFDQLTSMFQRKNRIESLKETENPLKEVLTGPEHFQMMSDWRYFGILVLLRAGRGQMANEEIAESLNLQAKEVSKIIAELLKLGVISHNSAGNIISERILFRTSEDFPEELMRRRRLQSLEGAKFAIDSKLEGERSFFAIVGADRSKLEAATELCEDFLRRLCLFLRDPDSKDVFEVVFNLFPRTMNPAVGKPKDDLPS